MSKQSHLALALLPCLAACQFSSPTTDADQRPFADVARSLYATPEVEAAAVPAVTAPEHLVLDAASGEAVQPFGPVTDLTIARGEWGAPAPRKDDNKVGDSYTKLKLGAFEPTAAFSGFDTGVAAEVALGREFLNFL